MKNVLVLGAGQSSPYLIHYLLENAVKYDWFVTVADRDVALAQKRVDAHPRGAAISFDVNDSELRNALIAKNDVVINMLAPMFQHMVALTCVTHSKHMISVSYQDKRLRNLENDANRKGVLILAEVGLDPGIDHMASATLIERIRENGGVVKSFESYGGGLPALDSITNPLKYVISWNPRNVVMAGESGAQYLNKGKIKIIPHHYVFQKTWNIDVNGLGRMEAYPNRDSLNYKTLYGFDHADTVIRGTLRYPGWSETWFEIVKLGMTNEEQIIPDLKNKTWADLTEMFLPSQGAVASIEERTATFLNINPTGSIMSNLHWLGLFSGEKIGVDVETSTEALTHLISVKLELTPENRDMVVLFHRIYVGFPGEDRPQEEYTATMVLNGERGGFTAMSKTVGLPAASVAKLLLTDDLPLTGCHIPTHPAIYKPLMRELETHGIHFDETHRVCEEKGQ